MNTTNQGKTMKSILEIIKPIKLLRGTHDDTATTGQGCAMNVIGYLNGEAQITDNSPCVCVTIRRPLIWLNDFLLDDERQALMLPLMLRAMGSATDDFEIVKARLDLLVGFANDMAKAAAAYATNATNAANAAKAATNATNAAAYAAKAATNAANAANAAAYAADAATNAAYANREQIKKIAFEFFENVLPKQPQYSLEVLSRAQVLADLVPA